MLAARQGEDVVGSAAALLPQVPVVAVGQEGPCWLAVLALVTAAPVVVAQPMAVQVVALAAEEQVEALVYLRSLQSLSAAMAGSTT